MSSNMMQVRFPEGEILFGKFYGCTMTALSPLLKTAQEVWDKWEDFPEMTICRCNRMEDVEIATSYGSGFYWQGRACRHCMTLDSNFLTKQPFDGPYVESYGCHALGFECPGAAKTNHLVDDELPEWWTKYTLTDEHGTEECG